MFLILPKFVPEPMGILAQRIVDTESLAIELQSMATERGILGTALIRNRLSLFLDVQYLREFLFGVPTDTGRTGSSDSALSSDAQMGRPIDGHASARAGVQGSTPPVMRQRILLVDDTPFFREVVKRYLAADGVEIITAVDGQQGLEKLDSTEIDLVVSDIEMPVMDGWQFCSTARQRGHQMPFVALTSLAKGEHEGRALECGFDDFEEKLDHDRLKRKVTYWLDKAAGGAVRP